MQTGKIIRITLFSVCLLFYAWHTLNNFLYSAGLKNYTNINAVIKQHLGKEYTFRISHPLVKIGKGNVYTKVSTQETYFVIQTRFIVRDINIRDDHFSLARTFFANDKRIEDAINIIEESQSRNITGNMNFVYDDKCRLASIDGEFDACGIVATFRGKIDHQGLHNHITVPALGIAQQELIADFDPDNIHGFALILPPDLKPSQELSIRPLLESVELELGKMEAMPVGVHKIHIMTTGLLYDKHVRALLHCDEKGIIYSIKAKGQPLQLDLIEIKNNEGDALWDRTLQRPTAN